MLEAQVRPADPGIPTESGSRLGQCQGRGYTDLHEGQIRWGLRKCCLSTLMNRFSIWSSLLLDDKAASSSLQLEIKVTMFWVMSILVSFELVHLDLLTIFRYGLSTSSSHFVFFGFLLYCSIFGYWVLFCFTCYALWNVSIYLSCCANVMLVYLIIIPFC